MASPAQIHANRLNAQRSTGPRTEEGKAVSRFNALTYGIEARSRVIPGEDPAELEALAADYHSQFHPVGPLEAYLVDTLVTADWNRRRYTRVESQLYRVLMTAGRNPADPDSILDPAAAFGEDVTGAKILQSVFRQLAAAQRSYFRALTELRRAQKERMADEAEPEAPPAEPIAINPAAPIGFVLPNPPQDPRAAVAQAPRPGALPQ
jgi:hypothetical protein